MGPKRIDPEELYRQARSRVADADETGSVTVKATLHLPDDEDLSALEAIGRASGEISAGDVRRIAATAAVIGRAQIQLARFVEDVLNERESAIEPGDSGA